MAFLKHFAAIAPRPIAIVMLSNTPDMPCSFACPFQHFAG